MRSSFSKPTLRYTPAEFFNRIGRQPKLISSSLLPESGHRNSGAPKVKATVRIYSRSFSNFRRRPCRTLWAPTSSRVRSCFSKCRRSGRNKHTRCSPAASSIPMNGQGRSNATQNLAIGIKRSPATHLGLQKPIEPWYSTNAVMRQRVRRHLLGTVRSGSAYSGDWHCEFLVMYYPKNSMGIFPY